MSVRLLRASRDILRTLDICPWIPIDVLASFVGAGSRVSVYQAVARLRAAGLVHSRKSGVSPLLGTGPITLFAVDPLGIVPTDARDGSTDGREKLLFRRGPSESHRTIFDPLRITGARGLAAWLRIRRADRDQLELAWWEAPWKTHSRSHTAIRLPAVALLTPRSKRDEGSEYVAVLPDLGTVPIARYRAVLRRFVQTHARRASDAAPVRLLIVTTNDDHGARQTAWEWSVQRLLEEAGGSDVRATIFNWHHVHCLLGLAWSADRPNNDERPLLRPHRVPPRQADDFLGLLGRHLFLTCTQIATLLDVSARRVRQLRESLISQGLVRVVPRAELPPRLLIAMNERLNVMDIAELTASGRRHVAQQLGLSVTVARREQGLFAGSLRGRRRALLHLEHTIGANQVFVSLAAMSLRARLRGADEALEEWRPAAACERAGCKPDGYGCYRLGNRRFGFFLEFDRGTERSSQYAAKLRAFYRYRDSGAYKRDFQGFPHVLVVTTSEQAESRFALEAHRACQRHSGVPLGILFTTVARIQAESDGPLGLIWRGAGPDLVDNSRRVRLFSG